MSDRLFELYESELKFINEEVLDFAGKFDKIAKRLRLTPGNPELSSDPHVDRLLSAFSLLTARLRHKLEDEFPEITQSLLSVIYPQFLAPTPSVAIARMQMNPVAAASGQSILLPKSERVFSEDVEGCSCQFRTTNDIEVLPIHVKRSDYQLPPFAKKPESSWAGSVVSAIEVEFETLAEVLDWNKVIPSRPLRFFLGGSGYQGNRIYEMLLSNLVGVGLFSKRQPRGHFLPRSAVQPCDFSIDRTNSLVDFDARTQPAFRVLWEFFTLPARFRFIDLDVARDWANLVAEDISIVFYLNKDEPTLRSAYSKDAIQLGCVPIINLFTKDCDPVPLNDWSTEYQLEFGSRVGETVEIYSIDRVSVSGGSDQKEVEFYKLFQPNNPFGFRDTNGLYWHATRRHRSARSGFPSRGSDVSLTLMDRDGRTSFDNENILHVQATCFNGDLPKNLSVKSTIKSEKATLKVDFQSPPLPARRIREDDSLLWKIVSHLSVNHLVQIQEDNPDVQVLKETLSLYVIGEDRDAKNAIESIVSIGCRKGTARLFERGCGEICRGLDIEIVVREEMLEVLGAFLFASALDRFFGSLVSINSFTRLTVWDQQRRRVIYQGVPRSGSRPLI